MSEKRFKYVEFTKNVLSFDDNGVCRFFNEQDFEDWLNELAGENEQLKDALNQRTEQCDEYYKENEQLKQQLELYQELYPTGKWICDLNSNELKKELSE